MSGRWRSQLQAIASDQRGAVLVIVAAGMVVLLGSVGVGVDAGRMYAERRAAQAAADHAATTAAHTKCTVAGVSDAAAIAAGQAASTRNGYADSSPSVVVTITPLGGYQFRASITSTIPSTFSRVMGFNQFDVSVTATGSATGCGGGGAGPGAVFAGGTCATAGKWAVDVSGSTQRIFGGVHSNDDVNVGGSSNDFDDVGVDPFTYVDVLNPNPVGSGNTFEPGYPRQVGSRAWPSGFEPSVAAPGSANDAYWNAWRQKAIDDGHGGTLLTSKITTITSNGVYYTDHSDGMDISSVGAGVTHVTLIARDGPIKVSVSNGTYSPDPDANGILALSGEVYGASENCDKYTVALSGSTTQWNGIIWAPGGQVEFSGSTNSAVNGSLIGWSVKLNGSNITIEYDPGLFSATPHILLLK